MNALSLFSGIGGIDLAGEWAGIKTVAMCEREPFCQKVLKKHWPDVPVYDDVCTLTKERLEADGIGAIELIHGGYPCQPFSVAGKREGTDDDRHLWPEVRRLLETIRPRWFVGENVAGHVTLGLDDVLTDLADINYTAQSFIIPAASVGAVHRRDRVFIVAHANEQYVERSVIKTLQREQTLQRFLHPGSIKEWTERSMLYEPKLLRNYNGIPRILDGGVTDVHQSGHEKTGTKSNSTLRNMRNMRKFSEGREASPKIDGAASLCINALQKMSRQSRPGTWKPSEEKNKKLCDLQNGVLPEPQHKEQDLQQRMFDNDWKNERQQKVESGAKRIKALGNAVVPQQIYPLLAAIKQIDDMLCK